MTIRKSNNSPRTSKTLRRSLIAVLALFSLMMSGCKQTATDGQKTDNADGNPDIDTLALQQPTDSALAASAQTLLTFSQAKTLVTPGQQYDEQSIETMFTDMQLDKIQAERYISDADYGGDSPAISYVWGKNVEFKNWKLKSTAADYFGLHFNLFLDKSRKTGTLREINVVSDSKQWYDSFMADAKAAGMELKGNIDKAIYLREGKEYTLKENEKLQYIIFDFSNGNAYDIELGYDDGTDM